MPPTDTPAPQPHRVRRPLRLVAIGVAVAALLVFAWFRLLDIESVRWRWLEWRLEASPGVRAVEFGDERPEVVLAPDATEAQIAAALTLTKAHSRPEDAARLRLGRLRIGALHQRSSAPADTDDRAVAAVLAAAQRAEFSGSATLEGRQSWTLACPTRATAPACARAVVDVLAVARQHPRGWDLMFLDQGERSSVVEDLPAAGPVIDAVAAERDRLLDVDVYVRSLDDEAGVRSVRVSPADAPGVRSRLVAALGDAGARYLEVRLGDTGVSVYGPQPSDRGTTVAAQVGTLASGSELALRGDALEAAMAGTTAEKRRVAALLPPEALFRADGHRGTAAEYLART